MRWIDKQTEAMGPGSYFLFYLVIFFSVGHPSIFTSQPVKDPPDNDAILYESCSSTGVMWMDTASREEQRIRVTEQTTQTYQRKPYSFIDHY